MVTQNNNLVSRTAPPARRTSGEASRAMTVAVTPLEAAETIFRRFAPRAISILSNPRTLEDGRTLPARLSANDCYVAMEEACRKMARVALRKFEGDTTLEAIGFSDALDVIFPDPPAYLTRCIRSVVSDGERVTRREVPAVSMDQPIGFSGDGDNALCLRDTISDTDSNGQPETALLEQDDRPAFPQRAEPRPAIHSEKLSGSLAARYGPLPRTRGGSQNRARIR